MVRLRELAILTVLAMGGMTTLIAAGERGFQIPGGMAFHTAAAKPDQVRLASNDTKADLRLAAQGAPAVQIPFAPLAPVTTAPDPSERRITQAMGRLRVKVPDNLYQYFDVFLYVSKAASGSLAQHMYMFHKEANGDVVFEQSFPVSTGRERHEKYFTSTPIGLFELDPNRFERNHYSRTWNASMPWAMFLNATIRGRQTGIALHSAGGHVADLGNRASGGCVRLPPEKAAELFHRFQAEERGYVPIFAFDASMNRTNPYGRIVRDAAGQPVMQYGYRVLLIIEDYYGEPALVAIV